MSSVIASAAIDLGKQLHKLIHDLRRRWILRRTVECSAVGIATVCVLIAIARFLTPASVWPEIFSAFFLLIAGTIIFATTPSIRDVLTRIDSTFGNDDLVSTAWSSMNATNPWNRTIVALAAHRCATLQSSEVVPRSIGHRGWFLIGLLVVGAVTGSMLAPMSSAPQSPESKEPTSDGEWTRWASAASADTATSNSIINPDRLEAKAEATPETAPNETHKLPVPRIGSDDGSRRIPHNSDSAGPGVANGQPVAKVDSSWTARSDPSIRSTVRSPLDPVTISTQNRDSGGGTVASERSKSRSASASGTVAPASNNLISWEKMDFALDGTRDESDDSHQASVIAIPSPYRALARDFFSPSTAGNRIKIEQ